MKKNMFCKKCGHNISDDAIFCMNCGTKAESKELKITISISSTKIVKILIGACVAIILIIAVLLSIRQYNNSLKSPIEGISKKHILREWNISKKWNLRQSKKQQ